jgi:hypothetical protein
MTAETLTPAELKMIKLKREQDALALKKVEAEKALQLEKDIKEQTSRLNINVTKDKEQIAEAQRLAKELGAGFKVVISSRDEVYSVTGGYINPEDPKAADYRREILWKQTVKREEAYIKHDKGYSIRVNEYRTYSSKWDTRGTNKGYRMFISGPQIEYKDENRAYGRVSTVREKITDAIAELARLNYIASLKKDALATTISRMKSEYPDATVESGYDFTKVYGKAHHLGTQYDTATITFPNGIRIVYRVYPDGSLSQTKITFPKQDEKDSWDVLKVLSGVKF